MYSGFWVRWYWWWRRGLVRGRLAGRWLAVTVRRLSASEPPQRPKHRDRDHACRLHRTIALRHAMQSTVIDGLMHALHRGRPVMAGGGRDMCMWRTRPDRPANCVKSGYRRRRTTKSFSGKSRRRGRPALFEAWAVVSLHCELCCACRVVGLDAADLNLVKLARATKSYC
jgi:hypothetical protein